MADEAGAPRPPGLFGSIARLGQTSIALLRTRLEILLTEIEEERIRFTGLVLVIAGVVFCLQMAVLLFVALAVVILWESHRLLTLGLLAAGFLVFGIALFLWVRHELRTRPRMFAATLRELVKDEERLGRGSGAQ